jgi:hypothetical protein
MINMKTLLNLVWIVGVFGDLVEVGGGRSNRTSLHCVILLFGMFFRLFKKKVVSLWVIKSDTNY